MIYSDDNDDDDDDGYRIPNVKLATQNSIHSEDYLSTEYAESRVRATPRDHRGLVSSVVILVK